MNRQELLTLIQRTDAELDRLLRKMERPDLIGAKDIPEQVASLIVKNFNRVQQRHAESFSTLPPEASTNNDEVPQAIAATQAAATQALHLATNAGALTGSQFVQTFAKSFSVSAATEMGKFVHQLQQQMEAMTIDIPTLGTQSLKTLEAQAKPSSPVPSEQQ